MSAQVAQRICFIYAAAALSATRAARQLVFAPYSKHGKQQSLASHLKPMLLSILNLQLRSQNSAPLIQMAEANNDQGFQRIAAVLLR
jgi:hypothetical protein